MIGRRSAPVGAKCSKDAPKAPTRYKPNFMILSGGLDRTRICDLLRVKQGVQTKNLFVCYHLQMIICSVESKWSPNPSQGLRSSILHVDSGCCQNNPCASIEMGGW
jgi:hypothetical protein